MPIRPPTCIMVTMAVAMMSHFRGRTAGDSAGHSTTLLNQLMAGSEIQPLPFLMLTLEGNHPVVSVIHRPHRHVGLLGSGTGTMDLAFLGDTVEEMPPLLVTFPPDAFEAVQSNSTASRWRR